MVDFVVSGPKIYSEQGILQDAVLAVEKNKIDSLGKNNFSCEKIIFPASYHLLPGFIDVHVHGAMGCDVMDATSSALHSISKALAEEGTTAFLATTMTASFEKINSALGNVRDFMQTQQKVKGAKILGVHLEGPFLSANKAGAQYPHDLVLPNPQSIQKWQAQSGDAIKLVTLAPELEGSLAFIQFLRSQQIAVSIGHTDATYAQTMAAIDAGCSHVTHLFNAMRGIHQREPGAVTAALLAETVSTELILDGVHLHPAIVQLALKMKGKEKIILVTDAMRAKCLADGVYDLGGQAVTVKNAIAQLSDGTLAGSTLKMSTAIRNLLQFTQCSMLDVIKFTAENPAKLLNIISHKGSLAEGKDADFVVLDEDLNVVLTVSEGEVIFQQGAVVKPA